LSACPIPPPISRYQLPAPLFGSIPGAESVLLALDDSLATTVAVAEAPHGTAPALEGKNVANPMAKVWMASGIAEHLDLAAG